MIKHVSGVYRADFGEIGGDSQKLDVFTPRAARQHGIETVYRDLALADDLSVGANIHLGRETTCRLGGLPLR